MSDPDPVQSVAPHGEVPLTVKGALPPGPSASSPDAPGAGVLAWGIETATGVPRHIRALPRERTGRASGMHCVSCGLSLEAFNAGALTWKHRPHFKHPTGIQRTDCDIVAARLALVHSLWRDGTLQLPRLRRSATAVGLSGAVYGAWREIEPEVVEIRSIVYDDRARALLTLPDGQTIAVLLRGTFEAAQRDGLVADACLTVHAGANAAELAGLSPEELRKRLTLLPDALHWQKHWADSQLQAEALVAAEQDARDALDYPPLGCDPSELGPQDRRRDGLLHRVTRSILAEAGRLLVPGWTVRPEQADTIRFDPVPPHQLDLHDVRVERGLDGLIPDLQCRATNAYDQLDLDLLVIEVVVGNPVSNEKLERLRTVGAAVLAVDLRSFGGRLTLAELRRLVLWQVECKYWLHHPLKSSQFAAIEADRERFAAWRAFHAVGPDPTARASMPAGMLGGPGSLPAEALMLGGEYRFAVTAYFDAIEHRKTPSTAELLRMAESKGHAWRGVVRVARSLEELGVPGGSDQAALDLVARLLSIRLDRGVSYAISEGARQTINHVNTEVTVRDQETRDASRAARASPSAALACIAFKVYGMGERGYEPGKTFPGLARRVHRSLMNGEVRFRWDPLYAPLVKSAFPEMVAAMDKVEADMRAAAAARLAAAVDTTPTDPSLPSGSRDTPELRALLAHYWGPGER